MALLRRAHFAAAALAAVFYWRTTGFGFTYLDDKVLILDAQPFLTRLSSVFAAFKSTYLSSYYRPIVTASFVLDAQWSAAKPFGYHLTNVALHAVASGLVVLLLRRLKFGDLPALLGGALFALHPALVETVAWVPGRNDSLLAVFALGAWLFLVRDAERASPRDRALHAACFALALFTKESALALPLLFFLHARVFKGRPLELRSWHWAVWGAATVVALFARANVVPSTPGSGADSVQAFFANLSVLVASVGKLFFPIRLAPIAIPRDTPLWPGLVAIAGLAFLASGRWGIRGRAIALGSATILVPLLPALVSSNRLTLENRLYLPAVGVAIIAAEVARALAVKKRVLAWGAAALLAGGAAIAWPYMASFSDRATFTEASVAASPHSSLAHAQRGLFIHEIEKDEERAGKEYEVAIALDPTEPVVHSNYGLVLMHRMQLAEAEREFRTEMLINPTYAAAYYNLGLVLQKESRADEAAAMFEEALKNDPNNTDSLGELMVHYMQRDPSKAAHYKAELERRGYRFTGP